MELIFREIHPSDIVDRLSLGKKEHQPLKSFLKQSAKEFHSNNITKTYVLVEKEEPSPIKGYLSLGCSEITLDLSQRPTVCEKERYETYPAIKIVRFAIDKKLQGQRFGSSLVKTTIARIKSLIMPHVGCRYLLVDSKPDAVDFYKKFGFIFLETDSNRKNKNPLLFLDMHHLE